MNNKNFIINILMLSSLVVLVGIFDYIDYRRGLAKESIKSQVLYVSNEVENQEENIENQDLEEEVEENPIVFDGLTFDELVDKLNKVLKSDLTGTGYYYAKYALEYNVDPYLAVAISLHETGCNQKCSAKVVDCNNVGGQRFKPVCYAGGTYGKYDTLEHGIEGFIRNIYVNYIALGLNTPELMQDKYVGTGSKTWAPKVEIYINKIKNA